jgi:transposase
VLAYKDDNHTQAETCAVFGISRATLNAWLKLRRETGSAQLRPRPKTRRSRKIDDDQLRRYLEQHPDAYLHEIAEVFAVSASAIVYACRRAGITRKKRRRAISSAMKPSGQPSSRS